jgi:hypothetical protein
MLLLGAATLGGKALLVNPIAAELAQKVGDRPQRRVEALAGFRRSGREIGGRRRLVANRSRNSAVAAGPRQTRPERGGRGRFVTNQPGT